ncbi:MAG: DNA polymerase III subunit beta [Chloroflexi bacterium]|nr:DNA polymerase III subunit beta [Chloroflexota bacterium]
MKVSVMQENLARGLQIVSRAVSSRSTLPVLANVLFRTEDAGLKLTATNLEIGITCWVPGKIDTDGAITVPARLITDLVNSLPSGDKVDLDLQGATMLRIRSSLGETHIKGIDAEDFPAIPTAGDRPTSRIAQGVLRRALEETAFAAATDEARPILTGVLARFEGATVTLAAADNYRIAVKTVPLLDPVEDTSIVVPARSLTELSRVLADSDMPVDIVLAPARNQILFHLESIDLVSRLIDGQFPNYQTVLPKGHATRAVMDRDDLLTAVKLAALIAGTSANIVKLQVGGAEGDAGTGLTVTANAEVGDNEGRVEASVEGDGTTIAFNARYLTDVLQNVDAEQFALELNGPLSPGVFRPIGDDQYVHVVMPVRTAS